MVPGIAVKVVNSYPAAKENVPVNLVNNVDFPTDGKPTNLFTNERTNERTKTRKTKCYPICEWNDGII